MHHAEKGACTGGSLSNRLCSRFRNEGHEMTRPLGIVAAMLCQLAATAISFGVSTLHAKAQTPLHRQEEAATSDPCEDPNHEDFGFIGKPKKTWDMLVCASFADSSNRKDYKAIKWLTMAAERGNWFAQQELAKSYGDQAWFWGHDHLPNYTLSYKWYDISEEVHGECIDRMPPAKGDVAQSPSPESNYWQVQWRDDIAKKMTPHEIEVAQAQSRDWVKAQHSIVCPTNEMTGYGGE